MNKISNLKLALGLAALLGVYLVITYFGKGTKSDPLNRELVNIDTALVTGLIISGTGHHTDLKKEGNNWKVQLPGGKWVSADYDKVMNTLGQLQNIKPSRLAAKDPEKWGQFQVDSSGTNIRIMQGDQLSLDMIIGRPGVTPYVRLSGEADVFVSEGFGGLAGKLGIEHYRNQTLATIQGDSVSSIHFNYPQDSSFVLLKTAGMWTFTDDTPADSVKVAAYLKTLHHLTSSKFAAQDGSSLGDLITSVNILSGNDTELTLSAFRDARDSVVIHSSANSQAYFNDPELGRKIFPDRNSFISPTP